MRRGLHACLVSRGHRWVCMQGWCGRASHLPACLPLPLAPLPPSHSACPCPLPLPASNTHIEEEINRLRAELLRKDQEAERMQLALAAEKEERERAQVGWSGAAAEPLGVKLVAEGPD